MALERTTVAIPLVGGLDSKSDAKSLPPAKLEELKNGEFTKGGSVRKRFGYSAIEAVTSTGVATETLRSIHSRADGLLATSAGKLYSYDPLRACWVDIGKYCPFTHTANEAAFLSYEQTKPDVATANGVTVYAWVDSRGGVRCAVYNEVTEAPYAADLLLQSSNASDPRCVAFGTTILIFYFDSGSNRVMVFPVATTSLALSLAAIPATCIEDINSTGVYDAVAGSSSAYITYSSDNTVVTGSRIALVNSGGTASLHTTVSTVNLTRIAVTAGGKVWVAGWSADDNIRAFGHNTSTLAQTDITSLASQTNVVRVAVAENSSSGATVWWERTAAAEENHTVTYQDFIAGPTTITTIQHSGIIGGGFEVGSYNFVILTHKSRTGLQNQYYLYRGDGLLCGRFLSGEGTGLGTNFRISQVSLLGGSRYQVALGFQRKLDIQAANPLDIPSFAVFEHKGIKRVVIDTDPDTFSDELDGTAYLTGCQLWATEGVSPVELGFHMFPDMLAADITNTATADADIPGSGNFNYRVYYEWSLANGQRMRSTAITRTSPTLNGNRPQLVIPTLAHTNKQGTISNVSIVVYRSEQNDNQLFYRVTSSNPTVTGVNGYLANDPSTITVTFTDGMSDATLITQEIDPQSQSLLPALAPEGPEFVKVAQGRLFLVGGGQRPNNVRFSKLHFDNEPVEFSDTLEITEAPDFGGKTTSIGHINDAVVVFKEGAIYHLEGQGPDNTGQDGFYAVKVISADTGSLEPASVYSAADGIYFKSPEGVYLLDQSARLQYIGADVEAYNGGTCTGTLGVPNTDQIIFLMSSGRSLMFDTYYKQWSTYTNHLGVHTAIWKGTEYVYLRSDSRVFQRNTTSYSDAGTAYSLLIRTAPLRLKDLIQGFWRARKLSVVGEYKSSHRLQVGVYYNRDEAPFDTFIWTPDSVLELGTWGSIGTWGGSGTVWGGAFGSREYQFQHKLAKQKCQTIRFEFEDLSNGPTLASSYELSEIALEVGLKEGLGRLSSTRKVS